MDIKINNQSETLFKDLNVGDAFILEGCVYVKFKLFVTDDRETNCIQLGKDYTVELPLDAKVQKVAKIEVSTHE